MWNEIDVVASRPKDRANSPRALRELTLLVVAALFAVLMILLG